MFKRILFRFLRGAIAGAVSTMAVIIPAVNGWEELSIWLSTLALAGIVGAITGGLLALDKWIRNKPQE